MNSHCSGCVKWNKDCFLCVAKLNAIYGIEVEEE